jgi:hypothetical protein
MSPILMLAMEYRGREAHNFIEGRASISSVYAAITATEALCYLLTIKDLPIGRAGRGRAMSNRVVRTHRYAAAANFD